MNFDNPPQNKIENQELLNDNLKNIQEVFKLNPELANIAFEVLEYDKKSKLELTSDIWTHATDSIDFIKNIKKSGKFVNEKEELDNFDKPETKGYETTVNKNAPYFTKGRIFDGYQSKKYLITTNLSDNSFQPNKNGRNEENLDETEGIAVLKPDHRNVENFRFWEIINGEYIELNRPLSLDQEMKAIQLYEKYLGNIFPESKAHDVFWHHSKEKFANFDDSKIKVDEKSRAGHFFSTKRVNLSFSPNTYAVVLNIKNPDTESLEKGDSVVIPDRRYGYEVIVKSQDQIHILGSEKDMEGFREFVSKTEKFNEQDGYAPEICKLLNSAPKEIIELIKNKKYYHVTLSKFGKNILENGMRSGEKPIEDADLKYFEDLYNKYSKNRNDQFFQYHIKGIDKDKPDNQRGVHVSSNPDAKLYQVPESLKFYLANLFFLLNSGRLNSEEQAEVQSTFDKYYGSIKTDKVSVLEISAIDPAVLNSVLGGYNDLDLETVKQVIKSYEPNIEIKDNVLPQHIKIKEEKELNIEDLDKGIKNSGFIIF